MSKRRRKSGALQFWVGTGLGLVVSATVVAIAAEFTYLRRRRQRAPGMDFGEESLVHDLSEAVHSGLDHIAHAASELAHTFADARRELVRFGLDPLSGEDSAGWYYDEDEDTPRKREGGDVSSEWES
jgi:hypothetical protein